MSALFSPEESNMRSEHLIDLSSNITLTRDWGLTCICAVYEHVLYGPETLLTRSQSLTAIAAARSRVLAQPRLVGPLTVGATLTATEPHDHRAAQATQTQSLLAGKNTA